MHSEDGVARYRFLTTWLVDAPIEAAWEAIHGIERWPEWWPGVRRVTKVRENVYDHAWRSRVPYTVRFRTEVARIERPHLVEAVADGELAGRGVWRLYEGSGTAVTYDWEVETTRPWMNAVAPVGRPLFAWNHHVIMRWGGEGLARHLGARFLAQS
jgi:carbon monoxide dehydrogenase subunit G